MSRIRNAAWQLLWIAIMLGFTVQKAPCAEPDSRPQSQAPVLLDFYSDWCGPCQAMKPTIDGLEREGYVVQRVNYDEQPELCQRYGITRLPSFVIVERGKEIDRIIGPTSVERLKVKMRKKEKVQVRAPASRLQSPASVPTPAWRYESPTGHRSAIVRIYCRENANGGSIGSGTLVRWNGRLVVVTVRHVVADAQKIIVELCTKKTHWARVLKVDAVWDCAVLKLTGTPEGVVPAEVGLGREAALAEGVRLESCGYGGDGRLACNSGLFLGYRRPAERGEGRDDWMIISGHARQGDSGGGVFNTRGQLIGVLWGTDGESVYGIQPGRIHAVLEAAVPRLEQVSGGQWSEQVVSDQWSEQVVSDQWLVASESDPKSQNPKIPKSPAALPLAAVHRNPTPPMPSPSAPACSGGDCCPAPIAVDDTKAYGEKPLIKWRQGAQAKDSETDARIRALIELQERQARAAAIEKDTAANAEKPVAKKDEDFSPLLAGLCMLGAIAVGIVFYFAAQKSQ